MRSGNKPMLGRVESIIFHLLLAAVIALAGWLSHHYSTVWDWSENSRNSLHPVSQEVLRRLSAPLKITSFAPDNPSLRERISEVMNRYQRASDQIQFEFVNPTIQPQLARDLGIQVSGELFLEYKGRNEKLADLTEESISNTIQRLVKDENHWIASLTGHGERAFNAVANHDLGDFSDALKNKGYTIQSLNLAEQLQVPDNTQLLIIPSPNTEMLPGEVSALLAYIESGGNLLWLSEPRPPKPKTDLDPLLAKLDLAVLPGVIVDANAASLGLDNPAYAVVPNYPEHPLTENFQQVTLYPYSTGFLMQESGQWIQTPVLSTLARSWNETGAIMGEVLKDQETEIAGPLHIGIALERQIDGKQQRVLVVGDGDFLSNTFLGNGGNLNLGFNIIRWLSFDDQLLNIPARGANDIRLELPPFAGAAIGFGFLGLLPALLILSGVIIWLRRRKR